MTIHAIRNGHLDTEIFCCRITRCIHDLHGEEAQKGWLNITEQQLLEMLDEFYEVVEIRRHAKMTEGDSVYVLARARAH